MMEFQLVQFIGESITNALQAYVSAVSSDVAQMVAPVVAGAIGLYYTVMGLMIVLGRAEGALGNLVMSIIKYALILAFALNMSNYNNFVVRGIQGMEVGMAKAFAANDGSDAKSAYQTIDESIQQGFDLSAVLYERGANRSIAQIVLGLSELGMSVGIALATAVIALPAAAMVIAAKAIIVLLSAIGPLFIACLITPQTKGFFDRWFAAVMTRVFQIALLSAVLALAMKMFSYVIMQIDVESPTVSTHLAMWTLVGITITMSVVLYQIYSVGAELGGGMASAAITFGGMAAKAIGFTTGVGNTVRQVVNPMSTRRDLESGMMVTAGRLNHLAAGNTAWNPRYMQHVMGQFGKNWGHARGGSVRGG
ncbi:conjugal transfer protein TraH [Stenotrophomonas maltophilia]|nr:conjugal transfer protein TraH [Stenotrophomonas maltophilia]